MSKDTGFANAAAAAVDPAYDIHKAFKDVDEAERATGQEPVPRHDYYHVRFTGGKGSLTDKKQSPRVRAGVQIIGGIAGTLGKTVFDDLYFNVSQTRTFKKETYERILGNPGTDPETGATLSPPKVVETNEDGSVVVERTPAEYDKAVREMASTLKRIAGRLKLQRGIPDLPFTDITNLDVWATQLVDKEAILAIRIEKGSGDYPDKNRFVWRSIAGLTDPVMDKKTGEPTGQTALEQAKTKTLASDKRIAKKDVGRKAGAFASQGPKRFFTRGAVAK